MDFKIIKPSITTHKSLIGNMFYSFMEEIVNDISNKQKLNKEEKEKLLLHVLTNSENNFNYKIYDKHRNTLY